MKHPTINFTDEQLITLHNLMMETGAGTIAYSWLDEAHKRHKCTMTLGRVEALLRQRGYTKIMSCGDQELIIKWQKGGE